MGIAALQREIYEEILRLDGAPFVQERPALFSPAAAAQDAGNSRGGFGQFAQILLPLEYTNWVDEAAAHVRSCYVGAGSSLNKVSVRGRQALEFLSWLGMRDLSRFGIGQIKHHVQLDENGWVASEASVQARPGGLHVPRELRLACVAVQPRQLGRGGARHQPRSVHLGVQGPVSLRTLEKVAGESLRDIGFNRSRMAQVNGMPVRVLRTGISGELGYELHGSADDANEIWSAVATAGAELVLCQLGFRSQPVQHIEAGIATNGLDYFPAAAITPGAPKQFRRGPVGGSLVPANGSPTTSQAGRARLESARRAAARFPRQGRWWPTPRAAARRGAHRPGMERRRRDQRARRCSATAAFWVDGHPRSSAQLRSGPARKPVSVSTDRAPSTCGDDLARHIWYASRAMRPSSSGAGPARGTSGNCGRATVQT
jgi:hypothetical protein